MKKKVFFIILLMSCSSASIFGQAPSSTYRAADPVAAMSSDLAKITVSVQTLSNTLKSFVDKFEKVSGLTMTEKQQKLILGMELLTRTEIRVTTLQKAQIELTQNLNATNSRISQIDIDLRPRNINNSTTYEGTTETEELRESKRQSCKVNGQIWSGFKHSYKAFCRRQATFCGMLSRWPSVYGEHFFPRSSVSYTTNRPATYC